MSDMDLTTAKIKLRQAVKDRKDYPSMVCGANLHDREALAILKALGEDPDDERRDDDVR